MPQTLDGTVISHADYQTRLLESIPASYVVWKDGDTYRAECLLKNGTDYTVGTDTAVIQAAIDAVHGAGGGDIIVKGFTIPETGLTHYSDVTLYEHYKGTQRKFMVLSDDSTVKLGLQYSVIDRPCIPMFLAKELASLALRGGYLTIIQRDDTTGSSYNTEVFFPAVIGYGTYEWKAKATTPSANRMQYLGFAEEACTQFKDSIFVKVEGTTYVFQTYKANALTGTNLGAQDWTTEKTFKIEWAANLAKLYVNDVLLATHTTNVPDKPLIVFMESSHEGAQATHTYMYGKDWKKIA